ncbi:hypothetical protein K7T73_12865 [Bacillus badius]|uniref:hypothetical protein n=1 Tax=Bacillus badius TaxID=1455 RepID=UPI001CC0BCE7|nr:hypothetical protein [Bacillus badius]UAT29491.1 hypothetical protein K7T73_12865 [Bacillus badius]
MEAKKSMENMVQNHEQRILALEKFQEETSKNIEELKQSQEQTQNSMLRLENVMLTSTKETKEVLQPFADHVLTQAKFRDQSESELKIKKLDTRQKIILGIVGAVFGTGGLAGIVAAIATWVQIQGGGQ